MLIPEEVVVVSSASPVVDAIVSKAIVEIGRQGRAVSSGVTFAAPDDVSDQFSFAEPVPLTVENLIRLGTRAGTSQKLAVHEHEGGRARNVIRKNDRRYRDGSVDHFIYYYDLG